MEDQRYREPGARFLEGLARTCLRKYARGNSSTGSHEQRAAVVLAENKRRLQSSLACKTLASQQEALG